MHRLAFALILSTACSSSEARDVTAPAPTPKPVEIVAKPETVPTPVAPAAAPAAPAPAVREPLPLTQGTAPRKVALRLLEQITNAIDAAGTDCLVLARNLTPFPKQIKKTTDGLLEFGQQFKTLPMSRALRDRQKQQVAFVKQCKASEPLAKTAIDRSIGAIQSYDYQYAAEHSGDVWR